MRQIAFIPFVIFSVDVEYDIDQTVSNRIKFSKTNFIDKVKLCIGEYKGISQLSYYFPLSIDEVERKGELEEIATLMTVYNQDCFLLRDKDNQGYLHYKDRVEHIGNAVEDSDPKGDYTLLPNKKKLTFRR